MASMTFTEKMGFLRQLTEFMDENAEALTAAGFNADVRAPAQKALNDAVAAANTAQESLKAQLLKQTQLVNEAMGKAYVAASGSLDAMAGVLGKDTEIAKVLKRLRSAVRQAASKKIETKGQ